MTVADLGCSRVRVALRTNADRVLFDELPALWAAACCPGAVPSPKETQDERDKHMDKEQEPRATVGGAADPEAPLSCGAAATARLGRERAGRAEALQLVVSKRAELAQLKGEMKVLAVALRELAVMQQQETAVLLASLAPLMQSTPQQLQQPPPPQQRRLEAAAEVDGSSCPDSPHVHHTDLAVNSTATVTTAAAVAAACGEFEVGRT